MFAGYFAWHYSYAYADGYRIYTDGVRFLYRFFSIERLIRSLGQPLPSMIERGVAMRELSRAYAAFLRGVVVSAGCVVILAWTAAVAATMVVWPFLPIITAGGLIASSIGMISLL